MLGIGETAMSEYIHSSDIEHISRIHSEVKWWKAAFFSWNKIHIKMYERAMPPYLLVAYTHNLLEYRNIDFKTSDSAKTIRKINTALEMISEVVMHELYQDIETRMQIINLFHRYGYHQGCQIPLRL